MFRCLDLSEESSSQELGESLAIRQKQFSSLLTTTRIFVRGQVELKQQPRLAIVGSRKPSLYGLRFVREFVELLASYQVTVISGGAFGIDACAHQEALRQGLRTEAWVVGPIQNPNPQSQRKLFLEIEKAGAILSPDYLNPVAGQAFCPMPYMWIQRNAWVVASAQAVIVVEAGLSSGTFSTAKLALEMGVPIFALPGSIYAESSMGVNLMLSESWAQPIASTSSLVEHLANQFAFKSVTETSSVDIVKILPLKKADKHLISLLKMIDARGALDWDESIRKLREMGCSKEESAAVVQQALLEGRLRAIGSRLERIF